MGFARRYSLLQILHLCDQSKVSSSYDERIEFVTSLLEMAAEKAASSLRSSRLFLVFHSSRPSLDFHSSLSLLLPPQYST